jgi:tight adherence protein B
LEEIRLGRQSLDVADEPLVVRRSEVLSAVPWLDRFLRKAEVAPKLQRMLRQADLQWTVGRLVSFSLLAALVSGYLVNLRVHAAVPAFGLAMVVGAVPFLYVLHKRGRRFERIKELLPEGLDTMVAAIRAGHSFTSALRMVVTESQEPLRGEFRQCFDEQNFGLDLRVAMLNLAERVPTREIRTIVTAILIQKETGGNLTEILEKVAHIIREDFRLQRQVRVHTAQGRLTGWILTVLPVVLGIGLYLINPENMSLLWQRPIGLKMIYASVVMTLLGGLIIRKIVRVRV